MASGPMARSGVVNAPRPATAMPSGPSWFCSRSESIWPMGLSMCSTGSYMPSWSGVTGRPNLSWASDDTSVIVACTPIVVCRVGTMACEMSRHQLPK
jgi:hypothetical protein